MQLLRAFFVGLLMVGSGVVEAQSAPGVTVINNPGGGTIAFAQMPLQHTVLGAMGRVLQYVHAQFGARPQVTRVMRGADGKTLAVTFTVKSPQGNGEIAGLALVAVSPTGPGKGAALTDRADRFRTTVRSMLQQLQSKAGARTASNSPSAASNGSDAAPQAAVAPAEAPAAAPAPEPAAASDGAAMQLSGKAAPLHQTPLPDGTGSVGLPDGWRITAAHWGEVVAEGPTPGMGLHFNWQFHSGAAGPGFGLNIPPGSDPGTTFKIAMTEAFRQSRKTPPSINIVSTRKVNATEDTVIADLDGGMGAAQALAHVVKSAPGPAGGYAITLFVINYPRQIAQQNQATAAAMFSAIRINADAVTAQIQGDTRAQAQWFDRQQADYHRREAAQDAQFANYQRQQDVKDRQFQQFDNDLLDRTVIRDSDLNAHGTVDNDLADALVQANPNRFQEVPASQYVKGIDY